MTLVVDFAEFAEAVRRFGRDDDCCIMHRRMGDSTQFTYVNPNNGVQIVALHVGSESDGIKELKSQGFETMRGTWVTESSLEHLAQLAGETYVAAVAYETKKGPGLWLDAYPYAPTEGTILRAVFEEFVSEGLSGEGDFEVFIHEAKPIVRILSPQEAERFLRMKQAK